MNLSVVRNNLYEHYRLAISLIAVLCWGIPLLCAGATWIWPCLPVVSEASPRKPPLAPLKYPPPLQCSSLLITVTLQSESALTQRSHCRLCSRAKLACLFTESIQHVWHLNHPNWCFELNILRLSCLDLLFLELFFQFLQFRTNWTVSYLWIFILLSWAGYHLCCFAKMILLIWLNLNSTQLFCAV